MLDVLFGEVGEFFACVSAEEGEGVGGHFWSLGMGIEELVVCEEMRWDFGKRD